MAPHTVLFPVPTCTTGTMARGGGVVAFKDIAGVELVHCNGDKTIDFCFAIQSGFGWTTVPA